MHVHTEHNAVPPIDATDLGGLLDDLAGIHPGIDLIRDGLRLLALDRHSLDTTQTLIAALAGSSDGTHVVAAIAELVARITHPDTNPSLRALPLEQQKAVQLAGETTRYELTDPALTQNASEASAAVDGT